MDNQNKIVTNNKHPAQQKYKQSLLRVLCIHMQTTYLELFNEGIKQLFFLFVALNLHQK